MVAVVKRPGSLRSSRREMSGETREGGREQRVVGVVTTLGCLAAVSTGADAQTPDGLLPPVTVDAPIARPKPAAAQPSMAQVRARTALRRRAREARAAPAYRSPAPAQPAQAASSVPSFAREGDTNPYANPNTPYKAERLSGNKFTEPLLNTPRTVTVLTKEILADKNATSLKDVARSTNGITIGTGEGGNAFGDRFFIRGFDARNDVFVDGIRDPGVSIRENFFTEQVEILRGPGSSFAGRGISGGALNIVTKQAGDKDFFKGDVQGGLTSDGTQRVTLDVNKVVTPDFAIRWNGMEQTAGVAGRNFVTDDRWGTSLAVKMTPVDNLKVTASYFHTSLDGLPDFGVPFYRGTVNGRTVGNFRPLTDSFVPRETYYGFTKRDFQRTTQDIGTIKAEYALTDNITLSNAFRAGHSVLDYVGTLPQGPNFTNANPALWTLNASPQSRYQTAEVIANQTDVTIRFKTGDIRHTVVAGVEISRETVARQSYLGLNSELFGNFTSNGAITVNLLNPPNLIAFPSKPTRSGVVTTIPVDTNSAYVIETANWNDIVILNGGVRYDNYRVSSELGSQSVTVKSDLMNYNAGLVIKPIPSLSLYGAFATSSNPAGSELDANGADYGGISATSTTFQALPPERNTAYEAGAKMELFEGRLLATGAAFETVKDKAREVIGTNILATGRYSVAGFDFGLTGKITDDWSIYAGYTIFNSKVDKSIVPANVGLRLANIADQSFTVLTKYKATDWLEIGGQAIYRAKIYGGTFAANANVLPDYWRFDAFAEAKFSKNWKMTLNVQNIFDKVYYDAFYRSTVPFTFIAPGRTVTLIASARF